MPFGFFLADLYKMEKCVENFFVQNSSNAAKEEIDG